MWNKFKYKPAMTVGQLREMIKNVNEYAQIVVIPQKDYKKNSFGFKIFSGEILRDDDGECLILKDE